MTRPPGTFPGTSHSFVFFLDRAGQPHDTFAQGPHPEQELPPISSAVIANEIVSLRAELKNRLDADRYRHVMGVEAIAIALAEEFAVAKERALLAALLHDLYKNEPRDVQRQLVDGAKTFRPTAEDLTHPSTWHGLAAAEYGAPRFGISDREILDGVAWHTTGAPHLGPVGLILYIADFIEPTRNFPGVEELRREVFKRRLHQAAELIAKHKIEHVEKKGKPVHSRSVAMLDWLKKI